MRHLTKESTRTFFFSAVMKRSGSANVQGQDALSKKRTFWIIGHLKFRPGSVITFRILAQLENHGELALIDGETWTWRRPPGRVATTRWRQNGSDHQRSPALARAQEIRSRATEESSPVHRRAPVAAALPSAVERPDCEGQVRPEPPLRPPRTRRRPA